VLSVRPLQRSKPGHRVHWTEPLLIARRPGGRTVDAFLDDLVVREMFSRVRCAGRSAKRLVPGVTV